MEQTTELKQFDLAEKTAKVKILTAQTAENIIEIGRTLLEVKENLSYGEFQNWLENEVNYSKSTAYNFMKVAKEFPNFQQVGNLGMRKLLALTGIETESREKVIANNDLENMTVKQVKQAIDDEKMVKEVNEFMERMSQELPKYGEDFDYTKHGFTDEDAQELKEIANNINQSFEDSRIAEYQELLHLKEIFKDDKIFARFVIQTGLKEAIEEFVFEREFPDKLFAVWEEIEYNLKNIKRS